jgi:DNA primase
LTPAQVHLLRRFTSKAVLSFDPDAAGQGAAVRSCELMVQEGFQVSVAVLPKGEDPDVFVRNRGGAAYQDRLRSARPYLEFLLDRAASQHDLNNSASRLEFLNSMLAVAAQIPSAAARDQFADRLAHRAGVGEEVVRDEIRKAAVAKKPSLPVRSLANPSSLTNAERDLLARLMSDPASVIDALPELNDEDLRGSNIRHIVGLARDFADRPPEAIPGLVLERLNEEEIALVTGIAAEIEKPVSAVDCIRSLRIRRLERERAEVQRQIDRMQEHGEVNSDEFVRLLARKCSLSTEIEALSSGIAV